MKKAAKILIIYQTSDLRTETAQTLRNIPGFSVGSLSYTVSDCLSLSVKKAPDVILLEITGTEDARQLIAFGKTVRIRTCARLLLIGEPGSTDRIVDICRQTFASGFLFTEQLSSLPFLIHDLCRMDTPQKILIRELILSSLTTAERRVLKIMLGEENDLLSSPKTLANQKTRIFQKLGLRNSAELCHIFRYF